MNEEVLELRDLSKHYDDFALRSVSLQVHAGEIVGLVGANGAGKTTLIKCILGLTAFDQGDLRLFGDAAPSGATAAARERIGVVFDTLRLPPSFSSNDVERLMASSYASWDSAQYARYLRLFGLGKFKNISDLSRGSGMKLAIACALAHGPELLLLDEATAGLDPMVRDEVLDALRSYQAEHDCGMILCTHITSDLEKIADRVVCLDGGRVAFSCPREDITDMAGLVRCRSVDLDALFEQGVFLQGEMLFERGAYGCNLLVADRFRFKERFSELPCEPCTIEDYMRIHLKGERR